MINRNSKIDKNIQKYVILSACNPHFAHKLIKDEDLIGLFLPCNVLIQELDDGTIKLSIINPEVFIDILNNPRVNTNAFCKKILKSSCSKYRRVNSNLA